MTTRWIGVLAAFMLLAVSFSPAQIANGIALQKVVPGNWAQVVPNATVTVCTSAGTGNPCTPLATIYTDRTLTTPAPNPFNADTYGNYTIYAPTGVYVVCVAGTQGLCQTIQIGTSVSVTGTANQIVVTAGVVSLANPGITPGFWDFALTPKTVATLPGAAANTGRVYRVTDAQNTSDCTTGTGATSSVCYSNGTIWTALGSGLLDPGSNGIVKRTAVNTTTVAASADIIGLFTACSGTQYLGADGACHASGGAPGGSLGQPQYYGTGPAFSGQINTAIITPFNWSQTGSAANFPALTGGTPGTITLASGITGFDTSGSTNLGGPLGGYPIYISDGANSETVYVISGTYTSGAGGTATFTPFFNHTAGTYTVKSASTGIQEAINATCGTFTTLVYRNAQCKIIVPSTGPSNSAVDVYGTIYFHTNKSVLSGYGAVLACHSSIRGPCLQIGDLTIGTDYIDNTVEGLSFRSPDNVSADAAFAGSLISSDQRATGVITITTSAAHNFRNNDRVTIDLTDTISYRGDVPQITVTGANTFTYTRSGASDIALHSEPGVVALSYSAILDNGTGTKFEDLQYDNFGENGAFNNFFDFWDDEAAVISNFNNNAIPGWKGPNWVSSMIYSGGASNLPSTTHQLASVISVSGSSITNGTCANVQNSNGLYVNDTVCEGQTPWEFKVSNQQGNFQGASFRNIYSEGTTIATNNTPWNALVGSVASGVGLLAGNTASGGSYSIRGNGGFNGTLPTSGSGATTYVYYIVANDTTAGTSTAPMPVQYCKEAAPGPCTITWPRIANGTNTITYDVLRVPAPNGTIGSAAGGFVAPTTTSCTGGAPGTCGSVTTAQAQCTGFVCSFADNTSVNTTSYTVQTAAFAASPDYWPGPAVMTSTNLKTDQEVGVTGIAFQYSSPSTVSSSCGYGLSVSGGFASCLHSITGAGVPWPAATLLPDGVANPGSVYNVKGRLNFSSMNGGGLSVWPHEIVTLIDGDPLTTRATTGYRPASHINDTFLGADAQTNGGATPATTGLAIANPVSISQFINALPNPSAGARATNWLEQLTASLKTLNVNLQLNGKAAQFVEGTAPGGTVGSDWLWGDSTAHRLMMNNNNGGAFNIPGVSVAGTSGHLAAFAANGIDLIDGGAAGAGTVTSSGPPAANQVAVFSTATNITGNTDFLYTAGTPNSVTVPSGSSAGAGLRFNGATNTGISGTTGNLYFDTNTTNGAFPTLNFRKFTTTLATTGQLTTSATAITLAAIESNGQGVFLSGSPGTTTNTSVAGINTASSHQPAATSGVQSGFSVGANAGGTTIIFQPTSGTAVFFGEFINPTINQTGGANGNNYGLGIYPFLQAAGGTSYLLGLGTCGSQAINCTRTDKFTVDNSGNVVSQGSVTATTSVKGATYLTATNCAANGTAANPSVASCTAAPAGAFSCDVAASGGTCTVNTTAVTANSEIFVQEVASEGTRLTVTCNTSPTVIPAITLASKVAGTSFTINMPTITTNPACFIYNIVN